MLHQKIRVLVVDDSILFRQVLTYLSMKILKLLDMPSMHLMHNEKFHCCVPMSLH